MDMQNVSNLQIPEGAVRTIHDKDNRLIWGRLAYDTKYAGNTYQQTYSGKNIIDFTTINFAGANDGSGTRSGSTYTVTASSDSTYSGIQFTQGNNLNLKPDTTYTFSATVQSTENPNGSMVFVIGAYSVGGSNIAGNFAKAGERSVATFTTPSSIPNNASIRLYPRAIDATAVFTDIMVEESATATYYEPYTGSSPTQIVPAPNPDYPQTVQTVTGEQTVTVTGKNLFNPDASFVFSGDPNITKTIIPTGVRMTCGTTNTSSGAYGFGVFVIGKLSNYIGKKVTLTTNATTSATNKSYVYIGTCNSSGGSRSVKISQNGTTGNYNFSISWDVVEDANQYLCVALYTTQNAAITAGDYVDYKNLQLEIGTATPYEAYVTPQSYTIDLGSTELCKIGDYQDYIYKSGDDWYVHKEVKKVMFDGSADENWSTGDSAGVRFFRIDMSDGAKNTEQAIKVISDRFIARYENVSNAICISSGVQGRILIFINGITNLVDAWKTWLSEHNVTAYYALATPTDTKITDATLLGQLNSVHEWLTRYGYNATVTGNLPLIVNRTNL